MAAVAAASSGHDGVSGQPEPIGSAGVARVAARDELRRAQAGLDLLPPRCREVVRLRKVEGLSTRETAERLGVGIDTVEKQLTLGIRAMTDFVLGGTGKIHRWSATARATAGAGNDE